MMCDFPRAQPRFAAVPHLMLFSLFACAYISQSRKRKHAEPQILPLEPGSPAITPPRRRGGDAPMLEVVLASVCPF